MSSFWIQFLQAFNSFPSIRTLVLAILMMSKSKSEVSRLCKLARSTIQFTTEDKKGMEAAWAGIFERHRPARSWVANSSPDCAVLLTVLSPVPDEERRAYYFLKAVHAHLNPRRDTLLPDPEGTSVFVKNIYPSITPSLYFRGWSVPMSLPQIALSRLGVLMFLEVSFTIQLPLFTSLEDAAGFVKQISSCDVATYEELMETCPSVTIIYRLVGEELQQLLGELTEVPTREFHYYEIRTVRFYTKLLEIIAARGLTFATQPPHLHSEQGGDSNRLPID